MDEEREWDEYDDDEFGNENEDDWNLSDNW